MVHYGLKFLIKLSWLLVHSIKVSYLLYLRTHLILSGFSIDLEDDLPDLGLKDHWPRP